MSTGGGDRGGGVEGREEVSGGGEEGRGVGIGVGVVEVTVGEVGGDGSGLVDLAALSSSFSSSLLFEESVMGRGERGVGTPGVGTSATL